MFFNKVLLVSGTRLLVFVNDVVSILVSFMLSMILVEYAHMKTIH